jgi:hypothetical protein
MAAILGPEEFQKFLTQLVGLINEGCGPVPTLYQEFSLMDELSQGRFVQCVYAIASGKTISATQEIVERKDLVIAEVGTALGGTVATAISIGELAEITKEMTDALVVAVDEKLHPKAVAVVEAPIEEAPIEELPKEEPPVEEPPVEEPPVTEEPAP